MLPVAIIGALCLSSDVVVVDLSNYSWNVCVNGRVVKSGVATGGRRYCPDIKRGCKTPKGMFEIITRRGQYYRSPLYPVGCTGNKCAKMPFAMKFRHLGESIHGAGKTIEKKNISHGCIHVSDEDAEWLNTKSGVKFVYIY